MNRRMKKKILAVAVGLMLIMQIAAKNNSDALEKVANAIDDPTLRTKFLEFTNGDTELALTVSTYDVDAVIQFAMTLIGTVHRMGRTTPSGLDCSGMVMLVHSKFGVELPHSSQEQARYGRILPKGEELQKGDLVFFHSTYTTSRLVTHSGIYLGDGRFVHTSSSRGVMISDMDGSGYWSEHYLFATRLGA